MNTVTIDVAKVKAAAATSPEARRALEVLCPEAFVPQRVPLQMEARGEKAAELERLFRNAGWGDTTIRRVGNLAGQGLWLHDAFTWAIEQDDKGESVLVAYWKESK